MTGKPFQRERVLAMLRAAGPRGVTTSQFLDARIPRFGGRLEELRNDYGHKITTMRVREGEFRYTLTRDGEVERAVSSPESPSGTTDAVSSPAPADGSLSLFDTPPPVHRPLPHWKAA